MNPLEPRERALEALLRGRSRPGPPTAQCLDAETMAAYADGGLSDRARAEAETHMAGCAHCQTVMSAIVTSADEVGQAPAQAPERAWWRLDVRWLVPLAGAAAAAVLWMVVPTSGPALQEERVENAAAPVPGEPAPEPPSLARETAPPAAPLANSGPAIGAAPPQAAAKKLTPEAAGDLAARQADQTVRERVEADAASRDNARPGLADADRLAKAEDRATAPAPAAQAFGSPDRSASTGTPTDLRSLDPAVRWRLVESGFVERSTNGGVSWDRLDTGVRTLLRAGVCPSPSTCWIVGDAGVVLLTTDAKSWRRLTVPTPEDLVSVDAVDARSAVVGSASGRSFRTTDAGSTWTP